MLKSIAGQFTIHRPSIIQPNLYVIQVTALLEYIVISQVTALLKYLAISHVHCVLVSLI